MFARIAIPRPLPAPLVYKVPDNLKGIVKLGHRVAVPFRSRNSVGFVISVDLTLPPNLKESSIKEITGLLEDDPVFSEKMLELLKWMSTYYCASIGDVCKAALPVRLNQLQQKKEREVSLPVEMHSIGDKPERVSLNAEQKETLEKINISLDGGVSRPILLHGVTGSGKTEVYLRAFERLQRNGGEGLLLVPEISLTPQLVQWFVGRFGDKVAIYHSGLTDAQRYKEWKKIKEGKVFAAVGTRSALFAPFQNLRLIVVDEEHDTSYKQEEGFLYNARDSAIMRAKITGASIILGSATPSIESFINSQSGKYDYLQLKSRATGALLPEVEIIDMRSRNASGGSRRSKYLSGPLLKAIEDTLGKGEQTLLLLNRRGFANFIICKDCGHVFECPNCNITLTQHMSPKRMLCHYCDFALAIPEICPKCNGLNLSSMGQGTERLEEEISKLFPKARIVRLDRDTSNKISSRRSFLKRMKDREIDILLGTQIVAKGHDFPDVTLVGVVDADISLHLPDFRSCERTFQLLTQVAGRAGRAAKPGKVMIQSYQPDHPSLLFSKEHNIHGFLENEKNNRKELRYPPFTRIANIKLQGNSEDKIGMAANECLVILKKQIQKLDLGKNISILGPAPAPLYKIRGKYRWQILIKASTPACLSRLLSSSLSIISDSLPAACRVAVDVDPINML